MAVSPPSSFPVSPFFPTQSSYPLLRKVKVSHRESIKCGMSSWGRTKPLPVYRGWLFFHRIHHCLLVHSLSYISRVFSALTVCCNYTKNATKELMFSLLNYSHSVSMMTEVLLQRFFDRNMFPQGLRITEFIIELSLYQLHLAFGSASQS